MDGQAPPGEYAKEVNAKGECGSGIGVTTTKLILSREGRTFLGNEDALMGMFSGVVQYLAPDRAHRSNARSTSGSARDQRRLLSGPPRSA